MASGGARRNAGQRPDPNSLRQHGSSEWVTLPAEGRDGPTPRWPFEDAVERRELDVWRDWWRLPQAVLWERNNMFYEVAAAIRCLMLIEKGTAKANDHAQFRQYLDSLGMTVKGMRANFWKLPDSADNGVTPLTEGAPTQRSNRSRFRVVNGDD